MRCLFADEDASIQVIPPTFEELLDDVIGIGKYRDKTFNWVLDYDTYYIDWMVWDLPSDGRTKMRLKHPQLLNENREKLRERSSQMFHRNNEIIGNDFTVQFKYRNKLCKGEIIGIEPSDDGVLSHTRVKIQFDYSPNICNYLTSHTQIFLYQDLLIKNNEYDPPPLRLLYIKYRIDIDTLKPIV